MAGWRKAGIAVDGSERPLWVDLSRPVGRPANDRKRRKGVIGVLGQPLPGPPDRAGKLVEDIGVRRPCVRNRTQDLLRRTAPSFTGWSAKYLRPNAFTAFLRVALLL